MIFIETPPHLIPQPRRLSPLRALPPAELVDDYASPDDLLRDTRDYTAVLDFNFNIPAEHVNAESVDGVLRMEPILEPILDVTMKDLLIPPSESSSGGASSVETLPGETLPETPSPSSAPDPMPAGDQAAPAPSPAPSKAASRRTARLAPHSEPALTRARGVSVPPRRQTRSGTASLVALFRATQTAQLAFARSLHQRRDAGHCSPPRECVAIRRVRLRLHRLRRKLFGGANQTEAPEYFQGGYEPSLSGTMEVGGRQGDRQPQDARRLRAGTCVLRPCWTKGVWLTLGQQNQGGRHLRKSSGSAGMGTGTRACLRRHLRTRL